MRVRSRQALEFACHSAACRPPKSGGTGGSVSGSFPPFFAVDKDGYQFIGYHFTHSSAFKVSATKRPVSVDGFDGWGAPGTLYVTFDPDASVMSGPVSNRPFAAEVWAKPHPDHFHTDDPVDWRSEAMSQERRVNVNTDQIRVRRVITTKSALEHMNTVPWDYGDDNWNVRQSAFGVRWDRTGNELDLPPATKWRP